ncbi:hypothetical protein TBLA_0B00760 [Henningerozyma blattae CBS 6284]|uniref:NAD-specific glutamate dehydrogenase n=1 Tax=Henningerozyma blattae (strain ATCC 34711 / CBS 6284 / DSM 70876 / NBRC 10599 / NRRL Y-10934 / UCD 77-7) TaxID=1071380 RepID=I2GXR7_HENB6|nr:hypothetical protein TBLA_0B00760 [Tetrapisispora blattae CBS 6284]CCH58919.1 hypothetical protein TBLA_0B00760 [Tetrapisispora blattae CBS 6284]
MDHSTTTNSTHLPQTVMPDISSLSISSMSDYHAFEFPGKTLQKENVIDILDRQGFIPDDLIENEVEWFYNSLGIDDLFFSRNTPELLANLIHSLYSSKLDSFAKSKLNNSDKTQIFNIKNKIITNDNSAIFMESNGLGLRMDDEGKTQPAKQQKETSPSFNIYNNVDEFCSPYELDSEIDDLYLDNKEKKCGRLVSFWTPESGLKLTFVYNSNFPEVDIQKNTLTSSQLFKGDIDSISDKTMVKVTSLENKKMYGLLIKLVQEREGPVIKTTHSMENNDEVRMLVAFKRFTTKKYYSAVNSLFHYYKLKPSKFYVESFNTSGINTTAVPNENDSFSNKLANEGKKINKNNDVIIFSIYLNKSKQLNEGGLTYSLEQAITQIEKEASLLYAIPENAFHSVYLERQFSPQEAIYAHIGSIFINHFINRLGSDYQSLLTQLNPKKTDTLLLELIEKMKRKLRTETYSQSMIINTFHKYHKVVSKLYKNFAEIHYSYDKAKALENTLSYKRLEQLEPFANEQEFKAYLDKYIPNDSPDLLILKTLHIFNKSILKTNFFVTRKVAISFRLDPTLIMSKTEYPDTPYGVFFVIGNTFKGFHIRFRDIARGGIRIVTSPTQDVYEVNSKNVIDENYNLAYTQQRKNKDIPEGGSKGVVLMNPGLCSPDQTFIAFSQYIDSVIDVLIKDPLKEKYVDLLKHEEILFLGPDEGTAGFANWATFHSKKRGCPWWKSFLTGKSSDLGGIPHDRYGMTSSGVRAYVNQLYDTLKITDKPINKMQTGGPDGDLGSNEILLSSSNEVYVGIVDGSGVLCDPNGIDKQELRLLAKKRQTVSEFPAELLSKDGFFVSTSDMELKLPDGTIIANGTTFRNTFHTEIFKFVKKIDIFVPCGGRPNSINLSNLHCYIDERTNKSKIPYIVEGANLFIAQSAKIALEEHGCILIKDASANKGGVTSSSLEVLASLSLNDEDFVKKFVGLKAGERTELYNNYVVEVQKRIYNNASNEFKQLWAISRQTGEPISQLSNILSETINKLNDDLIDSNELWLNDVNLRNYLLLNKILPKLLVDTAGPQKILHNIPNAYIKALLSSYLSSSFVYEFGVDVNVGKFIEYIGRLRRAAEKAKNVHELN